MNAKTLFQSQFGGNRCERPLHKFLPYDKLQPKATDNDVVILSKAKLIPIDLDSSVFQLEQCQKTGFNLQPIKAEYGSPTIEESTQSLEDLLQSTSQKDNPTE